MILAAIVVAWLTLAVCGVGFAFRREIASAWNEPILRFPVLIVESDDWGYGPALQADRLAEIVEVLAARRDVSGRPAVMTIALILSGPDVARNMSEGISPGHNLYLDNTAFDELRAVLQRGVRHGVFALQLHGMSHYWEPALHARASSDEHVRAWLVESPLPLSELLPAPLQSRWTDASQLPSKAIDGAAMRAAIAREVAEFRRVFGVVPAVVVPPTFVWNVQAEAYWAEAGVSTLVTPGRRYVARDHTGSPISDDERFANGALLGGGMICIVRNDYFEPSFGHRADRGLAALEAKSRLGRPTLLETHRSNFVGQLSVARESCAALDELLRQALERYPNLRFMATAELAAAYKARDERLIDTAVFRRIDTALRRLGEYSRLRKIAWATGLIAPAFVVRLAAGLARAVNR